MEWESRISDYLDDALMPEEVAKLFEWIQLHPDNARQFASAAFLHRLLEHRLSAMRVLQEDAGLTMRDDQRVIPRAPGRETKPADRMPAAQAVKARPAKSRSFPTSWRVWSIAAALLLVVGILAWPRGSSARLIAAQNARWGSGVAAPREGRPLPKGALTLESGLIQLGFDNGNQVIIEGPARFSIVDERAVSLEQGALAAIVTPGGRGLKVSTPTALVTDLGTEFGVKATVTATRVMVFTGTVQIDGTGAAPRELSAGSAAEVSGGGISQVPFEPALFTRVMPREVHPLDLVDLFAGGDGTGSASGVGINVATGRTRETKAVTIRWGDHRYMRVTDHRVLDGCFIPDGTMQVDSAGHSFAFPETSLVSYGLIWSGPNAPWEGDRPIATTLPQDAATPTSRVLAMHSNNGVTVNLDSVRALHQHVKITGFRARVGNSYRAGANSGPTMPLASIHAVVDGAARFEKQAFANTDSPMDIFFALSEDDHFLTLATTDGGDGNACDWILWTHPQLVVKNRDVSSQ
jgi:ferric-dicitrate binding protein FerR (iron transport regulator)